MLSVIEISEHLKRITYKDGWTFLVRENPYEGPFIRILIVVPNSYMENETVTLGINSFLGEFETVEEFERWLLRRIIRIEIHEAREFFKRDGKVLSDPHAEGEPYDKYLS